MFLNVLIDCKKVDAVHENKALYQSVWTWVVIIRLFFSVKLIFIDEKLSFSELLWWFKASAINIAICNTEKIFMSHLNYNHLYYFWMVCKQGSVTKAADALFWGIP